MMIALRDKAAEVEMVEKDSMALMAEQARSYQIELFEYAKKNNTIVCLGTGTGKTFISVLLIKHFEHEVSGPWLDPSGEIVGKRTIFLAPTVPLVEQQWAVLEQHLSVKTAYVIGDPHVDRWTKEQWNTKLQEPGVLVMTPEICRIAVDHDFIPMGNINLLVLDECHRASGSGHPYVQIMEYYAQKFDNQDVPRVLGLTASVVNAQVTGENVPMKIRELEKCLFSKAKTADLSVHQFGTKPTEIIVAYASNPNETALPIDADKMSLLKDSPDATEFRRMIRALDKTYRFCGTFCAKKLLKFREHELQKALGHPDCAECFRNLAPVKEELFGEIDQFLGDDPSVRDVAPKLNRLLEIIKLFENTKLSAVVFVEERLVAYVLYIWMDALSKLDNSKYSFINCAFIVGQSQGGYGREDDQKSLRMKSRDQQKIMRDFRNGEYNLLFATSVIEEGMDVPACNLIVRFDPPPDVRSYTQSKGRARAKPSLYVVLSAENRLNEIKALIDSFQETEQLVMHYCGTERSGPTARESINHLKEDPDLPPYINGRARITAASAVSLIYGYCQRFMRMKYPNVFPFFDVEETPDGFVCTLTMPIVCPVREKISNATHPLPSKDKARAYVALEMCKRLHLCGELADNLLPRKMQLNLYKLPLNPGDLQPKENLKKGMIVTRTKNGEKKRYVLPRKRADILRLREENDCDPGETFHLYVIKTEVIAWAAEEQNWRGEALFDPAKYPTWLGLIMRSESPNMQKVPKFPIFTRSGEERVSFVYAGSLCLDERLKKLCTRFNKYVFSVVLSIADNMMRCAAGFPTPCIVPVDEIGDGGSFRLSQEVLNAVGPPRLPDFKNFVFKEEQYDDAVVELLYHLTENQEKRSRDVHDRILEDFYPRFYVTKTVTCDEDGEPLTPTTTGYYPFDETMSFADFARPRTLRAGPSDLLETYQPVLTVEHCHKRLNMLRFRFASQQERRQKFVIDAGTTYLIPQYAALHTIKASLWRKITSIPSIIHRLNRLLIAEDIRLQISTACRLKPIDYPRQQWPPMDFVHSKKEEIQEMPSREFDALCRSGDRTYDRSKLRFPFFAQPDLKNCLGPSPCDIMKALTTKACDEVFDLERLELLGDSFLQIVATFSVLDRNPKSDIGELNVLRQYEVNNNHLLYRAHDKGLTEALEVQQFRPCYNFLPFGYSACPFEKQLLQREYLCVLVQYFDFERDSTPRLKDLRFCRDIQAILEAFSSYSASEILEDMKAELLTSDDLPYRHELPIRMIHDFKSKVGGDVVEALAGVYLEKCGPIGALRFFKWIGCDFSDTETDNFLDAFKLDFSAAQAVPFERMQQYKHLIEKVEKQIGYTFKSKGLVLQAITHHSCREHLLTEDNNKLAFVGEAVVDYLLTLYIYGLSSSLNPGQLTDLRSALINKQVTAHAVVRAELHTVLLYTNSNLFTAIKKYLSNVNDIGLRLNTVIDDSETDDAEEAEIPSPIARILQSVLGAVFIDSNKSLETVWNILVNIMGYEISLFTTNVPMSPIRQLCKMFPGTAFSKAILIREGEDEGRFGVKLHLVRNNQTETYVQISDTKKIAKITLAKRYLRKLETERRAEEIEERKRVHVTEESVKNLSDDLIESELQKSKFYRTR